MTFQPGGEKLTITQEFKGINEHDHLVADTRLEGTVPAVPQGATVQIDPYSAVYLYSSNCENGSCVFAYSLILFTLAGHRATGDRSLPEDP